MHGVAMPFWFRAPQLAGVSVADAVRLSGLCGSEVKATRATQTPDQSNLSGVTAQPTLKNTQRAIRSNAARASSSSRDQSNLSGKNTLRMIRSMSVTVMALPTSFPICLWLTTVSQPGSHSGCIRWSFMSSSMVAGRMRFREK